MYKTRELDNGGIQSIPNSNIGNNINSTTGCVVNQLGTKPQSKSTTSVLRSWRRPDTQDTSKSKPPTRYPSKPTTDLDRSMNTYNSTISENPNSGSEFPVYGSQLSPIVPQSSTARPYESTKYFPHVQYAESTTGAYSRTSPINKAPKYSSQPYYQDDYRNNPVYTSQDGPPVAHKQVNYTNHKPIRDFPYNGNFVSKSPVDHRINNREYFPVQKQNQGTDDNYNLPKSTFNQDVYNYTLQNQIDRRLLPTQNYTTQNYCMEKPSGRLQDQPKTTLDKTTQDIRYNYNQNCLMQKQRNVISHTTKKSTLLEQRLIQPDSSGTNEYQNYYQYNVMMPRTSPSSKPRLNYIPQKLPNSDVMLPQNKYLAHQNQRDFDQQNFYLAQMNQMQARLPQNIIHRTDQPRDLTYLDQNRLPSQKQRLYYPEIEFAKYPKQNMTISPKLSNPDQRLTEHTSEYLRYQTVQGQKDYGSAKIIDPNLPRDVLMNLPYRNDALNEQYMYSSPPLGNQNTYYPPRNISPRRTFQENMPQMVIPSQHLSKLNSRDYPQLYQNYPTYPGIKTGLPQLPYDPALAHRNYPQRYPGYLEYFPDKHPLNYPDNSMRPHYLPENQNSGRSFEDYQIGAEFRNYQDSKEDRSKKETDLGKSLKEFLESWEDDEDIVANLPDLVLNISTEKHRHTFPDPIPEEPQPTERSSRSEDQPLYILDSTNISSDALPQYLHIQQIDKLPDNIKGYYKCPSPDSTEDCQQKPKENKSTEQTLPENYSLNKEQAEVLNLSKNRKKDNLEFLTEEYQQSDDDSVAKLTTEDPSEREEKTTLESTVQIVKNCEISPCSDKSVTTSVIVPNTYLEYEKFSNSCLGNTENPSRISPSKPIRDNFKNYNTIVSPKTDDIEDNNKRTIDALNANILGPKDKIKKQHSSTDSCRLTLNRDTSIKTSKNNPEISLGKSPEVEEDIPEIDETATDISIEENTRDTAEEFERFNISEYSFDYSEKEEIEIVNTKQSTEIDNKILQSKQIEENLISNTQEIGIKESYIEVNTSSDSDLYLSGSFIINEENNNDNNVEIDEKDKQLTDANEPIKFTSNFTEILDELPKDYSDTEKSKDESNSSTETDNNSELVDKIIEDDKNTTASLFSVANVTVDEEEIPNSIDDKIHHSTNIAKDEEYNSIIPSTLPADEDIVDNISKDSDNEMSENISEDTTSSSVEDEISDQEQTSTTGDVASDSSILEECPERIDSPNQQLESDIEENSKTEMNNSDPITESALLENHSEVEDTCPCSPEVRSNTPKTEEQVQEILEDNLTEEVYTSNNSNEIEETIDKNEVIQAPISSEINNKKLTEIVHISNQSNQIEDTQDENEELTSNSSVINNDFIVDEISEPVVDANEELHSSSETSENLQVNFTKPTEKIDTSIQNSSVETEIIDLQSLSNDTIIIREEIISGDAEITDHSSTITDIHDSSVHSVNFDEIPEAIVEQTENVVAVPEIQTNLEEPTNQSVENELYSTNTEIIDIKNYASIITDDSEADTEPSDDDTNKSLISSETINPEERNLEETEINTMQNNSDNNSIIISSDASEIVEFELTETEVVVNETVSENNCPIHELPETDISSHSVETELQVHAERIIESSEETINDEEISSIFGTGTEIIAEELIDNFTTPETYITVVEINTPPIKSGETPTNEDMPEYGHLPSDIETSITSSPVPNNPDLQLSSPETNILETEIETTVIVTDSPTYELQFIDQLPESSVITIKNIFSEETIGFQNEYVKETELQNCELDTVEIELSTKENITCNSDESVDEEIVELEEHVNTNDNKENSNFEDILEKEENVLLDKRNEDNLVVHAEEDIVTVNESELDLSKEENLFTIQDESKEENLFTIQDESKEENLFTIQDESKEENLFTIQDELKEVALLDEEYIEDLPSNSSVINEIVIDDNNQTDVETNKTMDKKQELYAKRKKKLEEFKQIISKNQKSIENLTDDLPLNLPKPISTQRDERQLFLNPENPEMYPPLQLFSNPENPLNQPSNNSTLELKEIFTNPENPSATDSKELFTNPENPVLDPDLKIPFSALKSARRNSYEDFRVFNNKLRAPKRCYSELDTVNTPKRFLINLDEISKNITEELEKIPKSGRVEYYERQDPGRESSRIPVINEILEETEVPMTNDISERPKFDLGHLPQLRKDSSPPSPILSKTDDAVTNFEKNVSKTEDIEDRLQKCVETEDKASVLNKTELPSKEKQSVAQKPELKVQITKEKCPGGKIKEVIEKLKDGLRRKDQEIEAMSSMSIETNQSQKACKTMKNEENCLKKVETSTSSCTESIYQQQLKSVSVVCSENIKLHEKDKKISLNNFINVPPELVIPQQTPNINTCFVPLINYPIFSPYSGATAEYFTSSPSLGHKPKTHISDPRINKPKESDLDVRKEDQQSREMKVEEMKKKVTVERVQNHGDDFMHKKKKVLIRLEDYRKRKLSGGHLEKEDKSEEKLNVVDTNNQPDQVKIKSKGAIKDYSQVVSGEETPENVLNHNTKPKIIDEKPNTNHSTLNLDSNQENTIESKSQKMKKKKKRFRNLYTSDHEEDLPVKKQKPDANGNLPTGVRLKCQINLEKCKFVKTKVQQYQVNSTNSDNQLKLTLKPVKQPKFTEIMRNLDTVVDAKKKHKSKLIRSDSFSSFSSIESCVTDKVPKVIIKRSGSGYSSTIKKVITNQLCQPRVVLKRINIKNIMDETKL